MFPVLRFEAVRATGGWDRLRKLRSKVYPPGSAAKVSALRPFRRAPILAVLLVHNYLRFDHFAEFGHKYLNIGWQDRIQRWGLVNYHFLSRNLTCALCFCRAFGPIPLRQSQRARHVHVGDYARPGLYGGARRA